MGIVLITWNSTRGSRHRTRRAAASPGVTWPCRSSDTPTGVPAGTTARSRSTSSPSASGSSSTAMAPCRARQTASTVSSTKGAKVMSSVCELSRVLCERPPHEPCVRKQRHGLDAQLPGTHPPCRRSRLAPRRAASTTSAPAPHILRAEMRHGRPERNEGVRLLDDLADGDAHRLYRPPAPPAGPPQSSRRSSRRNARWRGTTRLARAHAHGASEAAP